MNVRTLTTLVWRFAGVYLALRALGALALFGLGPWIAEALFPGPDPVNPIRYTWPHLAGAAVYALVAIMLFRLGPRLTAFLAPATEAGANLDSGTLVAAGLALVGLLTFLEGGTALARMTVILRSMQGVDGDLGRTLWGVNPGQGPLNAVPLFQIGMGALLFVLAKPLARWWARQRRPGEGS
jgi:hypothetical protein